jgi:DNA-binding PadR family transcriptional regulator
MAEFNANDFEGTLDFFILSGFSDAPRSLSDIRQRVRWAERLLYLAATQTGKRGHGSLLDALVRLQREGCLKRERRAEQPDTEIIYSLTDAGERRLEQERARRKLVVLQFVEDADLDASFGRFLDRTGPLWPS